MTYQSTVRELNSENVYAILYIARYTGCLWMHIKNPTGFEEYMLSLNDSVFTSSLTTHTLENMASEVFYHRSDTNSATYKIYCYDHENFMRHFGMYFMKF